MNEQTLTYRSLISPCYLLWVGHVHTDLREQEPKFHQVYIHQWRFQRYPPAGALSLNSRCCINKHVLLCAPLGARILYLGSSYISVLPSKSTTFIFWVELKHFSVHRHAPLFSQSTTLVSRVSGTPLQPFQGNVWSRCCTASDRHLGDDSGGAGHMAPISRLQFSALEVYVWWS